MSKNVLAILVPIAIVALCGLVYWPVHMADFVWDDQVCMHDAAWLRNGEIWKHFVSTGFCGWKNYFRPFTVAMFAAELRIFDVDPRAMHLVSLGLHLANTILVGLLAKVLAGNKGNPIKSNALAGVAMAFYGLHPALIEPVVWISCLADLILTFLVLLGLLANAGINRPAPRAIGVCACFFLAACTKEAAITFPVLVLLFDWISLDRAPIQEGIPRQLRTILRRQWPVYAAMLGAGIAYLALRYEALGYLLKNLDESAPLSLLGRSQRVADTLLTYWRIFVWPMTDLAPTHLVDSTQFIAFSTTHLLADLIAGVILLAGIYGTYKRNPFGYAICAVNITLFPVLHILSAHFDASLYHERYLMLGLALALSLLPRMISVIELPAATSRTVGIGGAVLGLLWLSVAVMNIRVTVPLWSNNIRLWQWDLAKNPQSPMAKTNLLALYIDHNDHVHAHELADRLLAEERVCVLCLINVAALADQEEDVVRARKALELARIAMGARTETYVLRSFLLARGKMHELEHELEQAADDYHDAMDLDPLDPKAHMVFALFLASQGKVEAARAALDQALALWPPDVREGHRREFERTLAAGVKATGPVPVPSQP